MNDHIAAAVLLILAGLLLAWGIATELRRRRQIQAAMSRHPSARTTMTERERRYHGDDSVGR